MNVAGEMGIKVVAADHEGVNCVSECCSRLEQMSGRVELWHAESFIVGRVRS